MSGLYLHSKKSISITLDNILSLHRSIYKTDDYWNSPAYLLPSFLLYQSPQKPLSFLLKSCTRLPSMASCWYFEKKIILVSWIFRYGSVRPYKFITTCYLCHNCCSPLVTHTGQILNFHLYHILYHLLRRLCIRVYRHLCH